MLKKSLSRFVSFLIVVSIGLTVPLLSIKAAESGFPNFSPHPVKTVKVRGLTGKISDFTKANKVAELKETPKGYTWHHTGDGLTLELIKTLAPPAAMHSGGAAIIKRGQIK